MESLLQNVEATVSFAYSEDGQATNPSPDAATVTVTRDDGTALYTDKPATDTGTGTFAIALTPADMAQLGRLTFTWKIAGQTFTTYAAVQGGFYFTIAEFRAVYASDDQVQALSAAAIAEARSTAEEIIEGLETEDGCHQAFVPRAETFHLSGDGTTRLSIPRYRLRSVVSCSVGGATVDPAGLSIEAGSVYSRCWRRGFANVAITVAHGWDAPPRQIKDAAILLAFHRAIKGPIDDRAATIAQEGGGLITLAQPGRGGRVTGIPEVDEAIDRYQLPRIRPVSISLGERGRAYPPLPVL